MWKFPDLRLLHVSPHSYTTLTNIWISLKLEFYFNNLTLYLALLDSLTVQFLIACGMQEQKFKAWSACHVNDISVDLGRQWLGKCLPSKAPPLVQSKERVRKIRSFNWWPLSNSVYLGRHLSYSHDTMHQAFPLCFCILQAIKNWMMERPGNSYVHTTL